MKILSIEDCHGRDNWKQFIEENPGYDKVIFVGDYVDSFTLSNEIIKNNFLDIIEFKKTDPDNIILLYGNHELMYALTAPYESQKYGCSGYRPDAHFDLYDIFKENKDLFQAAYQYKEHIWTHAGIHRGWYLQRFLPEFNKYFPDFLGNIADQLNKAFNYRLESLFDVGYARGGSKNVGGIFWNDKSEASHKPLKGYHQIVGHTPVKDIESYSYPKFDCSITYIDCEYKPFVINL